MKATPSWSVEGAWAGLVLMALAAAAIEVAFALPAWFANDLAITHVGIAEYVTAIGSAAVGVTLVHTLPAWALLRWAPGARTRTVLACAVGAAAAWAWQDTIAHGDGLRAHPHFPLIQPAMAVGSTLLGAALVRVFLLPGLLPAPARTACVGVVLVAGLWFNHKVLRSYQDFHGHLTLGLIVGATWIFATAWRTRGARVLATLVLVAAVGAGASVARDAPPLEANLRRLSPFVGPMLSALPLTRTPFFRVEAIVDPNMPLSPEEAREAEAWVRAQTAGIGAKRRGNNVIVIVLESTRADTWADPAVTRRFQDLRKKGVYIPRAVSQYPATPLAYGALFASLPPSVLVQHPFWVKHRLPVALKHQFDDWFLTEPNNYWFRNSTISGFIVPRAKQAVHRHRSTHEGLTFLWKSIANLTPDRRFFAWAHLYDPHAPYVRHREFKLGHGLRAAYRSEVASVDQELGRFLEWFYRSQWAKNTLVILIGDHGEALGERFHGEPYVGHHVYVHSSISEVPFYASGPGLPEGAVRPDVGVSQLDVMPTIFDFVGVPIPRNSLAQGRSLYRELEKPTERPLVTEAFSLRGGEFFSLVEKAKARNADPLALRRELERANAHPTYAPKVAVQVGRWKLVRDLMLHRDALYDVARDPKELEDLAGANPDALSTMQEHLESWRRVQRWTLAEGDRLR